MPLLPRRLDVLNKLVNAGGLRVTRHIPYGLHSRQKLDVYRPAAKRSSWQRRMSADEPLPVIVYIYGGIWQFGDRNDYEFIAATLAKKGFVVVVPDYRLYPEVKFPGFLDDNATAIAWVLKNIWEYGGDDRAVFLMGHSSGAYNVTMLGLDPTHLQDAGVGTERIAGVIGLAGPYEFPHAHDPIIAEIFSAPVDAVMYQPISYVRQDSPPTLLVHGGKDNLILPRSTAVLATLMREAGATVETRIYPRLGHIGILLGCLPHFSWRGSILKDVLNFVAACRNGEFVQANAEVSAPALR